MSALLHTDPTTQTRIERLDPDGELLFAVRVETATEQRQIQLRQTDTDHVRLEIAAHGRPPRDVSCDPLRAMAELLGEESDPHRTDWLVAQAARAVPTELVAVIDGEHPAVRLLRGAYPVLRELHRQTSCALSTAIPSAVDHLLSQSDTRTALAAAVGPTAATKPAVKALAAAMSHNGQLRTRELAMIQAAAGLTGGHIVAVLSGSLPANGGLAAVHAEVASAAATALATLNPTRHRDLLTELITAPNGHSSLISIGIAQRTGRLDLAGVRNDLAHLHSRAREAIAEPGQASCEIEQLAGQPAGLAGHRFRVATADSHSELAYAGKQMRNCLGQYRRGELYADSLATPGSAILLVVDEQGRYQAAIQIDNGMVVQASGPRNGQLDAPLHAAIDSRLQAAGIAVPELDDFPF